MRRSSINIQDRAPKDLHAQIDAALAAKNLELALARKRRMTLEAYRAYLLRTHPEVIEANGR